MKHDFGKYIYYNPTKSNIEPEEFSKEKRDRLIAQGNYKEAVNYSRQYYPKDPEKAAKYNLDIANLERTAKIYEAKLQRLNKDDRNLVQFVDLLYQGNLTNYTNSNTYIDNYNNKINSLGSDTNNDISITFKPKKQYGLFGWDWLAADNEEYNIDVFYKNSGLSRAQLESAGVKFIDEEDGSTTIKVNKGHELFNKIIMGVPMGGSVGLDWLSNTPDSDVPGINDISIKDSRIPNYKDYTILYNLQQEVKDAQEKRDNIFKKYEPEVVQKSGYTMRLVTPELLQVEQALIDGSIKDVQYKTLKNIIFDEVNRELITTPFGNYDKVYTNRFNERGDETFREAPVDELVNLQDKLRTNIDDLEYSVYNNGVEEGLMITYKGKEKKTLPTDVGADLENHIADVSFSVFIPGMAADFINSAVGLDPNYRASKELLDMANYGITHELEDDTVLHADNNGRIFAKGVEIDRNEALRLINKDFVVEDARRQFLYDSVNKDNNIIDEEAYDLKAKKQAIAYATETYPEVNLFYDYDNTSEYDNIEDYVFSKQIAGEIQEPVAEKMPYDVYNVYTELFDVYRRIMTGLTNHKNIYN